MIEEVIADTAVNNVISSNTLLTYNPNYPMVKVYDSVDASGTIANFADNRFINIYKSKLPVIDILTTGGTSYSLDKDNITTIDSTATNFTYFGYKTYTSTGAYSGSSLITNGTFVSDITGWTADNVVLSHDNVGDTLQASQ